MINNTNTNITPNRATRRRGRRAVAMTVLCASFAAGTTAVGSGVADAARDANVAVNTAGSIAAKQNALAEVAPVPVTGTAVDGTLFTGMFTLQRFTEKKGVLYAVGQLDGQLGGQAVSKKVSWPVTGASNELPVTDLAQPQGFAQPQQLPETPGACDILTLALGPLDLDLLGLRVALDEVNLLIEAIPGAGNLLGNLLCGVAGLLDGGLGGGLGGLVQNLLDAIANLLNGILGGL